MDISVQMTLSDIEDEIQDIEAELDEIKRTHPIRYQWIVARSQTDSDAKALAIVNRGNSWLHSLPNKVHMQELAARLKVETVTLAKQMYQQAATKAAQTMLDLLDSTDDRVRYQASKDILDRLGYKPAEKVDVSLGMSSRTIEEVVLLAYGKAQAKRLAAGETGDVIDGEYSENGQQGAENG